jgi:hypothetical protein
MSLFDGLAGAGISAATGNFLGAGLALAGLGLSVGSAVDQSKNAQGVYQAQENITNLETQENAQRQQAMVLSANRQSLQTLRQNQQLRAQATAGAVSGGAQYSSGYQGGQQQVESEGLFNLGGINKNLEIGQNLFGLSNQINQQKLVASFYQSKMASDQGTAAIGAGISKAADPLSRLLQGFSNPGSSAAGDMS